MICGLGGTSEGLSPRGDGYVRLYTICSDKFSYDKIDSSHRDFYGMTRGFWLGHIARILYCGAWIWSTSRVGSVTTKAHTGKVS